MRNRECGGIAARLLLGLFLVGVVAGVAAVFLAFDALAARGSLLAAKDQVERARNAVTDGDIDTARQSVDAARTAADDAVAETGGILWTVATRVPLAGRTPRTVRSVAEATDATVSVAEGVVAGADRMLGDRGELPVRITDGRLDLEPLEAAASALEELPLDDLRTARDRLASSPDRLVPGPVVEARGEALELVDGAVRTLDNLDAVVGAMPTFLGAEGPRSYLVAMQNNAELRGTGGIIGNYAILTADRGHLSLSETQDLSVLSAMTANVPPPMVDVGDTFRARYEQAGLPTFLPNINADPDLPTTGAALTAVYQLATGDELDGLIFVDPVALSTIMRPIGPVRVPADVVADYDVDVPNPVPPERLPHVTMVQAVTDPTRRGGADNPRDVYLRSLAQSAYDQIIAGGWNEIQVTRAISRTASARHLQLFSTHEDEQAAFESAGVAARMPTVEDGDLLAVTANNAAGNKMDVHVGHVVTGDVELDLARDGTATRDARLVVSLDNPLPTSGMDEAIIGSIPYDPDLPNDYIGPPGLNRTWFTVWAPATAEALTATDADGQDIDISRWRIHDHLAVDHYLETTSKTTNSFSVDLSGPVEVHRAGPDLVYRLTLWQQAKAIPTRVDVEIATPDGWTPTEVEVVGGGGGGGMGVNGEPGPEVQARIDGDRVRVSGDVNRDTYVEVRMARGAWSRFLDWLGRPAF